MNKRDAVAKSREGKISVGELRQLIALAKGRGGMSKVNPMVQLAHACDIYAGALDGREDSEVPQGMRVDPYSGRVPRYKPTRDSRIIANILRDCAP